MASKRPASEEAEKNTSKHVKKTKAQKTLKKLKSMVQEIGPEQLMDSLDEYALAEDWYEDCTTVEDVQARKEALKAVVPPTVDNVFKVWMKMEKVLVHTIKKNPFHDIILEALSNGEMAEFENLWGESASDECFSMMQAYRDAAICYFIREIENTAKSLPRNKL